MKWTVIVGLLAALIVLRFFKPRMLIWAAAWWVACFSFVRFGFKVPIPHSAVMIYMTIVTGGLLVYITTDAKRLAEVRDPIVAFMTEKRFQIPLIVVALLIPALVSFDIYHSMTEPLQPPGFARTVHPAPPASITVHGKEYNLLTLENPYAKLKRSDPAAYAKHLEIGREVYFRNCVYCHGDAMRGAGMYAYGLNPIAGNFQDPGTIAMLRSSFLFWRISKGAPGLPDESGPWDSAMPEWERFLDADQMWDVILYLYDFTGHEPRAVEATAGGVEGSKK